MKKVVLTRVDDRFLHGQITVSWIPFLNVNEVVVIDGELANDEFMASLLKSAEPENVNVNIFTVYEAAEYLKKEDENKNILILLKHIEYINTLIELNVDLHKINIGNLSSNSKRKKYFNSVFLTDDEFNMLLNIQKKIEVEIKMLPKDKSMQLLGN